MNKRKNNNSPLKIAVLGHKTIPSRQGGIEIVVEELTVRMAKLGHKITVYNRSGHHVSGSYFLKSKLDTQKRFRDKTIGLHNLFHGTAFSVIFHKDFYVEALQKDFKPNDRVESLLCLTGLDGCKVKTLEDCRLNVSRDFNFADDQIRKQYIKTNQYFERVLNEDGRSF